MTFSMENFALKRQQGTMEQKLPSYTVGATVNTVRILRYLGSAGEPVRLVRITADLGLNASTCLNILRTLADEDMVLHHAETKTYTLGFGAVELSRQALSRSEGIAMVQPLLDDFSRGHGVSVMLWRRIDDSHLMTVAHSGAGSTMHIKADVGSRLPLLSGSMGRVIAAADEFDEATLRARFAEVPWQKNFDFDKFLKQAEDARRKGWGEDRGEIAAGRHGLSVAVPNGPRITHILNVALFADELDEDQLHKVGEGLVLLAHKIAPLWRR